jgi:hypothetical protein
MQTTQEHWLDCQLDRGMFSDAIAGTYPAEGNTISSVFVPASVVRGEPGTKGKVRVMIMKQHGKTFALLPSSEQTVVPVQERDVTDSP